MTEPGRLEARCRAAGLRLTAPRRALLDALRRADATVDAVALLQAAQRQHAELRLGTVYRFLRELERLGLAHAEAQPHGRMRWRLAEAGTADDGAVLRRMHDFLHELEALGLAAPATDVPPPAPDPTLRLLQQVAACLGYRLAPLQPPAY
jgi:Fe2+ or Zn2+ uptake regulation protein